MKRIICDDDDDDDDVEVNGARTPKDVTNSSLNKAANKFKRTPIEVSPGWLDARNPNILDEVERNMNIRVAKEERVIPKKKREVPKMVSNTPSTSSFTSSSSSSPSFLESPLDFNERRKQDLLNLQKKPVVSLLKKELGNTLLDRDRSFFKSKEERMKQEDRSTRLVRRASIPPKENTERAVLKPDKAHNKVVDLVDIHSEEEEEMENDDEAQMERENLTQADIRAQAQRIFKTCEDFSANLCKAIRAWRGKRGAESENGEASCVELTAINTSSQSGVKLLSEDDIRDFCPDLVLKAYQLVGINWLKLLHENHVNGVLADDMVLLTAYLSFTYYLLYV